MATRTDTTYPAFRVEITRHDGSITLSPRLAFRSIAAHGARVMGREPGVLGARVVLAA